MTSKPFRRKRGSRLVDCLLIAALAAMGWVGEVPGAEGVEGSGFHSGPSRHDAPFEHANGDPPCAHEHKMEYEGVGTAQVRQGRIGYSGPVTVKYLLEDVWAAPAGTIYPPQSNHDPATACYFNDGNGSLVRDAEGNPVPALGAVPVKSASISGEAADGSRLRCGWDESSGATYRRGSVEETLTLPAGRSHPADGAPGSCTITPSVGRPRTSNTQVISEGSFQACVGVPPFACQHANSMNVTAAGPIPPEPPPLVASIQANSAVQGASQNVHIKGEEFASDAVPSFSGPGISVGDVGDRSFTAMTASITVARDAAAGPRDVLVTNGDGRTGICSACFTVLAASGAPSAPPGDNAPGAGPAGQGPPGTTPGAGPPGGGGGSGTGQSLAGPSIQSTFVPASTLTSPGGPSVPTSPGVPPPAPPGGTGLAPVTAQAHAPAAVLALEAHQEAELAPQAGTRIMMVGGADPMKALTPVQALSGTSLLGTVLVTAMSFFFVRPTTRSPNAAPAVTRAI